MWSSESPQIYRSMGFWNDETQQSLLDLHVAVGGMGGMGYLVGAELAHMGVQNITAADPEPFEPVNANRVLGAREDTYGKNKAEVFRDDILAINHDANVSIFPEGISIDNVDGFVEGADVIIDALELSMPELGTMVAQRARNLGIFVVNAEYIGHGAQVTVFDPKSRMTFERFMGLKGEKDEGGNIAVDDAKGQVISTDRMMAYVPPYADLETLKALKEGASLPSNMIGAGLAAQMAVSEVLKIARLKVGEAGMSPTIAPSVRWMDAYTGKSGSTNHPRLSFYRHLITTAVHNSLGKYERASYSKDQRLARGDE